MEMESSASSEAESNSCTENMQEEPNTNATIPQYNKSIVNSCRLCLKEQQQLHMNIFAKPSINENNLECGTLAERLHDLLHVKYEYQPPLPQGICERCYFMVEAFTNFRANVLKCEEELQMKYKQLQMKYNAYDITPGLNGNPGEFVPEADYEITEVNVEQDYESSEDEFSMESETETEENQQQLNVNKQQTATSNLNLENGEVLQSQSLNTALSTMTTTTTPDINSAGNLPQLLENATSKTLCYLCQYCDMAFTTQPACHDHETKAHDAQLPYACNYCMLRHSNRQSVIAHIRQQHQPDRPYVCTLCGKGFCRRSDLKKHTIVHTGVRPYRCTVCTKSFSRNTNLTKHMRIHNSMKPHVCQACPRSFGSAQELMQHAHTHNDVKPYQCEQCPASYSRRDKLHIHKLSHLRRQTEQQFMQLQQIHANYAAGAEQQQYNNNNNNETTATTTNTSILATHLLQQQEQQRLTHTKTRTFNCDICAKSFTREQDLQRHKALHLDDLFMCKICNIGFARREKLMRHIQEQHTPLYNCEMCNLSFAQAESLDMHMKMHQLQQYAAHTTLGTVKNNLPTTTKSVGNNMLTQQLDLTARTRLSAEEMSFYSQMVPTMNLGFYSETRPET